MQLPRLAAKNRKPDDAIANDGFESSREVMAHAVDHS
jgi:hypothetical protein